jgi:holo-[acyl-carrier protein] synthase
MIYGIGTDIIETGRIQERTSRESGFKEYVFHPNEIRYCESMGKPAEHFAARFAAKEALLKALGTGLSGGLILNEIEIVNHDNGKPSFRFHGVTSEKINSLGKTGIHLSLSHLPTIACAMVVIETS